MEQKNTNRPRAALGRLAGITAVCAALILFSCAAPEKQGQRTRSLKIVSWNLQTFFDANFDGNEYSEYRSAGKGWSREKYDVRLDRLASVIKAIDADVVIMEELEKEAQLQDIANRLAGTFNFSMLYRYGAFASDEGSSIGCAVISRYPLSDISVHSMDFRGGARQPSMRPIIRLSVRAGDKTLVLLVNHWKSKSGGAESSEIWRRRQERLLARLMGNAVGRNEPALAAGDFNKDISEFDTHCRAGAEKGAANMTLHGEESVAVYSPWILEGGDFAGTGSYWFRDSWERIDHFFAAGDITLSGFRAESAGEWAYDDGHPRRYQLWSGRGYSDHLPISCTVTF